MLAKRHTPRYRPTCQKIRPCTTRIRTISGDRGAAAAIGSSGELRKWLSPTQATQTMNRSCTITATRGRLVRILVLRLDI